MSTKTKWISTFIMTMCAAVAVPSGALAQIHITRNVHIKGLMPADEARTIFVAGARLFDEDQFPQAESKFREVLRRFPQNPIADRADYYLIRTLAPLEKRMRR